MVLEGLVLYLPFDEGSGAIAYDESGNGNNGTLYNNPVWVDGKLGKALSFNGVDDYCVIPFTVYGWDEITIVEWVYMFHPKPNAYYSKTSGIGNWDDGPSTHLQTDPAQNYNVLIMFWLTKKPDGSIGHYAYDFFAYKNQWVHLVRRFTRDREFSFWINGVKVYSAMIPPNEKTILEMNPDEAMYPATYRRYVLGANVHLGEHMKCMHDEVRIYNRALSDWEIRWLYENSRARLGAAPLSITDFNESSEPVGAEWYSWENQQVIIKRFIYGIKRTWRITCIEKDIMWGNSAAKYLQEKMRAGETETFTVNEGNRYTLPATTVHIVNLEIEMEPTGNQNIRKYTVTLKEI